MLEHCRVGGVGRSLVVGLLLALAAPGAARAEELPFTALTPEGTPPLSSGSVQKLLQDRLGFVWLAYYSTGIARFDGHALEPYSLADGLPDVTVRELTEDAQGHLWVGTESGVVVSTRPLEAYPPSERIRFTAKVGDAGVLPARTRRNCLVASPDGWVWQGTGGEGLRLYRIRAGQLESRVLSTDVFDSGRSEPVTAMVVRRDGTVWVALGNGVLLVYGRDGQRSVVDPQELGAGRRAVSALAEGPSGTLWVGFADGGVSRFSPKGRPAFEDLRSPLQERIASLHESSAGELWAASLGGGLARFSVRTPRAPEAYHPDDGLLSDTFWHVMEDRAGSLWFAQNGGISRLAPDYPAVGRFTKMRLPEPSVFAIVPPFRQEGATRLPSAPVTCPAEAGRPPEPPLWLGTGGGLVALCNGRVAAVLGMKEGLASNSIYSLGADRAGRLWIGTAQGLNCLTFDAHTRPPARAVDSRAVTLLGQAATLSALPTASAPIYAARSLSLAVDERRKQTVESLWFTGTGGLWSLVGDEWFFFARDAGVPVAGTTGVELDAGGRLWVGTADRGLLRSVRPLTRATLQQLAAESQQQDLSLSAMMAQAIGEISVPVFAPAWDMAHGAPSNSIRNLLRAGNRLLVGTSVGLAVLDAGTQAQLAFHDASTGLGGDAIVGLARSPVTQHTWVSQNGGLAELDADLTRVLRVMTKHDGLSDDEAWAYGSVAAGADGTLYFGTPKGVSLVRPALRRTRSTQPLLRWTRVDSHQDAGGHFEITFEYSALDFGNPRGVRYQSRLLGYDDTWSAPTRDTKLRFTNLAPGTYTFELRGATGAGVWSETPLRHTFTVSAAGTAAAEEG